MQAGRRIGKRGNWSDLLLTDAVPVAEDVHQVEIFNQIVNGFFGTHEPAGPLTLHVAERQAYPRPTVGLSPGAAYGSAKRWLPDQYVETARLLSHHFDVVLLGGPPERAQGWPSRRPSSKPASATTGT